MQLIAKIITRKIKNPAGSLSQPHTKLAFRTECGSSTDACRWLSELACTSRLPPLLARLPVEAAPLLLRLKLVVAAAAAPAAVAVLALRLDGSGSRNVGGAADTHAEQQQPASMCGANAT